MLLLAADLLPPFMSLLLSLVHKLFPFPSFAQNTFFIPFSSLCHLPQNLTTHLPRSNNLLCRLQKMKVLPTIRAKKSSPMILLLELWAKKLPSLNQTASRRRKGVATQIMSAISSSIHGTMLTFTSPWCLVTIRLCRQAMCGFLFAIVIQRFLGPLWLPPFPILIYAKGYRSSCLSSLNLGRVLPWVGRSGWTGSCSMWVSWLHYSRPVC